MIVKSLLENDMYKFPMWQIMLHKNPSAIAEYHFICRNTPQYPLSELENDLNQELNHLCSLSFQKEELDFLTNNTVLSEDFIAYLSIFKFQRDFIQVSVENNNLYIKAKGPQIHIMGFEIFCLYIVSELYFKRFDYDELLKESRERLQCKIKLLKNGLNETKHPFEFFDFGLRRRWSANWQDEMVCTLNDQVPEYFKGTSNVYLAKKYGLTPIGTMAHEYLQSYQATSSLLRDFQKIALEDWVQEFRGSLAIALTDTISMDAFLNDFDLYFAKLFDGIRHDSGCPFVWGDKSIEHFNRLNIDPNIKRLVFSDGLDFKLSLKLHHHFANQIQTGFGIGTNLSNDTGVKPLNIVMKLMRINELPVAKLSDAPGKTLCEDQLYVDYLKSVFNYQVN